MNTEELHHTATRVVIVCCWYTDCQSSHTVTCTTF